MLKLLLFVALVANIFFIVLATAEKCNKPNEEYDSCMYSCPPQTCESIGQKYSCPVQTADNCEAGCKCISGYYRNAIEECISEKNCLKCTGPNEYYSCGGACDNVCATLSEQNQTNCPISNIKCNEMCYCEEGYARDANNTCIPIEDCPKSCNGDPNAVSGCGVNCGRLCSNYNSIKPIACPAICHVNGCDCKKGYVLDSNIGECVLPKDCTPTCGVNEEFSTCVQSLCRHQNCTQKGQPVACPLIDSKYCKQGCVCQQNYLRTKNGTCVPEDQCDKSCNGDPNAVPGCGVNCGRLCSNYKSNKPIACPAICHLNGCDCKKGYVLDSNIGKCVLPEDCTPKCGANEEFSTCTQGICRHQNCTQKGQPVACPRIDPKDCKQGCVCKQNYLRAKNETCVPEDQCHACPEGELYNTCPPEKCDAEYCPKTRNSPTACKSTKNCHTPRCTCRFNEKRDWKTNKCIPIADCPPFKCYGPNEEYQSCPSLCPGENCSDYINNSTCPKYRIGIVVPCKPACRCKENHYRNCEGICIKAGECTNCDEDGTTEAE